MTRRPIAFVTVASVGFALQTAVVWALTVAAQLPPELATAVAVELAVVHNYLWHERWTWSDRSARGFAHSRLRRFVHYQLTTGCTSLAGNLVVVAAVVHLAGLNVIAANVVAVVLIGVANYAIADRWVFARPAVTAAVLVALVPGSARAASPSADTIRAWDAHIAQVELAHAQGRLPAIEPGEPQGRDVRVPGGVIHEWSGSIVIPGITVRELVHALMNPGTPPPQEDVLEARVLAKTGDTLRVYLKLRRTAIITVTYDTEHTVTFDRHDPACASSRSVATSIHEDGGGDRGFLWRLNSYWTYRDVGNGVKVDVLSVSLSRDAPALTRPIVAPVASRIARESMRRTLEAMKNFPVR